MTLAIAKNFFLQNQENIQNVSNFNMQESPPEFILESCLDAPNNHVLIDLEPAPGDRKIVIPNDPFDQQFEEQMQNACDFENLDWNLNDAFYEYDNADDIDLML